MKSLLRYIGSKKDLDIAKFISNNNLDIEIYCEPFSGGFSAGLNLIENGFNGKVILNDLDYNVCNFWICLKEDWSILYSEIINMLDKINTDCDLFQIIHKYETSEDLFKRAACEYIYRKCLTMSGLSIQHKKFNDDIYDFFLQSELLQKVEIRNIDYWDIIKRYDSSTTLFLIDPPYDVKNVNKYYRCNSSEFNHKELRDRIENIQAKCIITYNDNENIRSLYKDSKYKMEQIERNIGHKYNELYFFK